MFSQESMQQLRERIDLIEVLSTYLPLKRMGATYKALCPFHDEHTPSFMAKRGDSHYHCFGCGAHGDAIAFLMQHQHLSFQEAVETLGELFHVSLQKEQQHDEVPYGLLKECLEKALEFYQFYLLHTEEGHQALLYLYQRNLSLDFIRRYGLGFAPESGGLLSKWMHEQKVSRELMTTTGLLSQAGREFFHGRILFPIYNARGGIVGFSGRKIKEETYGGKYINTPETPLFKKSRLLFGLHLSRRRIAKEQRVLVVEGQIDCLRLIDAGLDWTVAALGTAFGEAHVKELVQLGIRQAILLFDGDAAGLKAASKVGDYFQQVGISVKVCRLPLGSDPDSFLQTQGVASLEACIQQGTDYLQFQLTVLQQEAGEMTPAAKHQVVTELTKQIKAWQEPVMVHESLKRLAQLTQLPDHMIGMTKRPVGSSKQLHVDVDAILELDLLRWLVMCGQDRPEFILTAQHFLDPSCFTVERCRALYCAYLGGAHDLLALGSTLEDSSLLDEMMARKINLERAEAQFLQTVQKLADRQWLLAREEVRCSLQRGGLQEQEVLELTKQFGKARPCVTLTHLTHEIAH